MQKCGRFAPPHLARVDIMRQRVDASSRGSAGQVNNDATTPPADAEKWPRDLAVFVGCGVLGLGLVIGFLAYVLSDLSEVCRGFLVFVPTCHSVTVNTAARRTKWNVCSSRPTCRRLSNWGRCCLSTRKSTMVLCCWATRQYTSTCRRSPSQAPCLPTCWAVHCSACTSRPCSQHHAQA